MALNDLDKFDSRGNWAKHRKEELSSGWYINGERWDSWDQYFARLRAELTVMGNHNETFLRAKKIVDDAIKKNGNGLPF